MKDVVRLAKEVQAGRMSVEDAQKELAKLQKKDK